MWLTKSTTRWVTSAAWGPRGSSNLVSKGCSPYWAPNALSTETATPRSGTSDSKADRYSQGEGTTHPVVPQRLGGPPSHARPATRRFHIHGLYSTLGLALPHHSRISAVGATSPTG